MDGRHNAHAPATMADLRVSGRESDTLKDHSHGFLISLLVGVLLMPGCARRVRGHPPPGSEVAAQSGIASWYGHPYHGQPAASGEIYDMERLTAAHRTLPFETRVRVENLENGRSIDLRINDRGPFVNDRIIDISHAAARALGMLGTGTARVRVQVLSMPSAADNNFFAVQVGAFMDHARADRLQQAMQKRYGFAKIIKRNGDPILWRVLVGRVGTLEEANALSRRLRAENPEIVVASFVVHLD
jgi:rare lipoprotein A